MIGFASYMPKLMSYSVKKASVQDNDIVPIAKRTTRDGANQEKLRLHQPNGSSRDVVILRVQKTVRYMNSQRSSLTFVRDKVSITSM